MQISLILDVQFSWCWLFIRRVNWLITKSLGWIRVVLKFPWNKIIFQAIQLLERLKLVEQAKKNLFTRLWPREKFFFDNSNSFTGYIHLGWRFVSKCVCVWGACVYPWVRVNVCLCKFLAGCVCFRWVGHSTLLLYTCPRGRDKKLPQFSFWTNSSVLLMAPHPSAPNRTWVMRTEEKREETKRRNEWPTLSTDGDPLCVEFFGCSVVCLDWISPVHLVQLSSLLVPTQASSTGWGETTVSIVLAWLDLSWLVSEQYYPFQTTMGTSSGSKLVYKYAQKDSVNYSYTQLNPEWKNACFSVR